MSNVQHQSMEYNHQRAPTFTHETSTYNTYENISINNVLLTLMRVSKRCHQSASLYRLKGIEGSYRAYKNQEEWIRSFIDELNKSNFKQRKDMCKFSKTVGTITDFCSDMYSIAVDNTTVRIPYSVMHKYPVFSIKMLDENHLKIGSCITLVKKDAGIYYPDHETYGVENNQENKPDIDGSYLLKDAQPYQQENTLQEIIDKLSETMPTLSCEVRMEALKTLTNQEFSEEQKVKKLTSMISFPLDFVESQTLEKKKSLFHYARKSKDDKAQVKEIVESIVAMCNSEEQQPCKLVIGVDDKTNKTCKLQDEIASEQPNLESLDKFESTFLYNFIKAYTYDNLLLMSSLKYNWYNYHGDLILIIDIDYHGDPIICKGGRLPYRCGTVKSVAEGIDLVNMVKKLTRNNVN